MSLKIVFIKKKLDRAEPALIVTEVGVNINTRIIATSSTAAQKNLLW